MGVWHLPRFIGLGRAKQLILSGQLIDARAAQAIDMVDDVVDDIELMGRVQNITERYLQNPWAAVLRSKRMINQAFDLPFDDFCLSTSRCRLRPCRPRIMLRRCKRIVKHRPESGDTKRDL